MINTFIYIRMYIIYSLPRKPATYGVSIYFFNLFIRTFIPPKVNLESRTIDSWYSGYTQSTTDL